MRTYYIVEHATAAKYQESLGPVFWQAHKRGIFTLFNCFHYIEGILETRSYVSPDACEKLLRESLMLAKIKPRIIRVVNI